MSTERAAASRHPQTTTAPTPGQQHTLTITSSSDTRIRRLNPRSEHFRTEVVAMLKADPYVVLTTRVATRSGGEAARPPVAPAAVLRVGCDMGLGIAAMYYSGPAGEDYPEGGWYSYNPHPPHAHTRLSQDPETGLDLVFPYSSHLTWWLILDVLEDLWDNRGRLPRAHIEWALAEFPEPAREVDLPDLVGEWVTGASGCGPVVIDTVSGGAISIEADCELVTPAGVMPLHGQEARAAALLEAALRLQIIRSIDASPCGTLAVEFAAGHLLLVGPGSDERRAWTVTQATGQPEVVCAPRDRYARRPGIRMIHAAHCDTGTGEAVADADRARAGNAEPASGGGEDA